MNYFSSVFGKLAIYESNGKSFYSAEVYLEQFNRNEIIVKNYNSTLSEILDSFLVGYKLSNGDGEFIEINLSKNLLTIKTDYFGSYPLFYYFEEKKIIFSTKLNDIINELGEITIDKTELNKYLMFGYPVLNNKTFYENILLCDPNSKIIFNIIDSISVLTEKLNSKVNTNFEIRTNAFNLLQKGIKERIELIKPDAIVHMISAGIDSGILLYNFKKLGINVHTATFGYGDSDDVIIGRERANKLNYKFTTSDKFFYLECELYGSLIKEYSILTGGIGIVSEIATFYFDKELEKYGDVFVFGEGGEFYRNRLESEEYFGNNYLTPQSTFEKFMTDKYKASFYIEKVYEKYGRNRTFEKFYLKEKHPKNLYRKYLLLGNIGMKLTPLVNKYLLNFIYNKTTITERESLTVLNSFVKDDCYKILNKINKPFMNINHFWSLINTEFKKLLRNGYDLSSLGINVENMLKYIENDNIDEKDKWFLCRICNLSSYLTYLGQDNIRIKGN